MACEQLGTLSLEGCTIYASGQPCPMCLAAIHLAGIRTVYYANTYEQPKYLALLQNLWWIRCARGVRGFQKRTRTRLCPPLCWILCTCPCLRQRLYMNGTDNPVLNFT